MYQAMKRHSLLAAMPRLIIALVLAAVLLGLTAGGVFTQLGGAEDLNALGANVQAGDYVEFDMSQLMSGYASLSNSGGKTLEVYYIVHLDGDVYLSMHADGKYEDKFERATSQSYDYYRNDSGILNKMGTIRGQVTELDEESYVSMSDWITQSKLNGFDSDEPTGKILALEVQLNQVGLMSVTWNWILFILGILCLAWFVIELLMALNGRSWQQVTDTLGDNAKAAQEWEKAEAFGNARIGEQYIWYSNRGKSYVFPVAEVVWVYKQFDSKVLGRYKWPVSIFTSKQDYHELCVAEDTQREKLIQILRDHGGHFVAGYNQDNYDQYVNNFKAFCARAAADDPDADAPLIKLPD